MIRYGRVNGNGYYNVKPYICLCYNFGSLTDHRQSLFIELCLCFQTSMAYRNAHTPENCTSPGPQSPLSPPSPSFGASPVGSPQGTSYGESYFLNPQQQLQTNALQHQLEQFSMVSTLLLLLFNVRSECIFMIDY